MQRSFSIVDDEDDEDIDQLLNDPKDRREDTLNKLINDSDSEELSNSKPVKPNSSTNKFIKESDTDETPMKALQKKLDDSDSEEHSTSPKKINQARFLNSVKKPEPLAKRLPRTGSPEKRGPSIKTKERLGQLSSESDQEDSENEEKKKIPGEYDPAQYENLDVDEDAKEIFQYIIKYTPQQLTLDYKFKPFIPEFLPAVGDIDAFLKVVPPETNIMGEPFDSEFLKLGLTVLDEPAANQSDPALLYLQLRATSVNSSHKNTNAIVKKVDNVEKNVKVIDKWIKDISDLHKSKSSPVVRYSEPMPDIDDLMQEWPEEMENFFKENEFPKPTPETELSDYIETVCKLFNIPTNKNKIQSLHLLFALYASVKSSQIYQANKTSEDKETIEQTNEADQLVLD